MLHVHGQRNVLVIHGKGGISDTLVFCQSLKLSLLYFCTWSMDSLWDKDLSGVCAFTEEVCAPVSGTKGHDFSFPYLMFGIN